MFLADLHVSSTFSNGKMNVPELIDFYGERGFSSIAVTDQVSPGLRPIFEALLKTEAERAWRDYNMVVTTSVDPSKTPWFSLARLKSTFHQEPTVESSRWTRKRRLRHLGSRAIHGDLGNVASS